MISAHLLVLQVVLPLLAAPTCLVLARRPLPWLIAATVSWASFGIAILLLHRVLTFGTFSYELGGWAAPWGIEYRIDPLNALVLLIVAGISSVVVLFAKCSVEHELDPNKSHLFYSVWLLCLTGLLGIAATADAFNLFVFLEISSLSSYVLISLAQQRRALTAAFQYLIMGTIGATFLLIGIGLLYAMTGTLNMADLSQRIPAVSSTRTVAAAFVFITVGVGIKAAIFPLHYWLPNAYCHAPSAVTAFFAGTTTKVAVYVLLRFAFTVFGAEISLGQFLLNYFLLPLGIAAALIGSTVAIFQRNVKRMLGYSSVAQIGYMVIGIGIASSMGLSATVLHLFNHAVIKTALFLSLGCIFYRLGSVSLTDLAGVGRTMPWTMAAFVIGGFSVIGLPLTVGFISKWYLVLAALEKQWWGLVGVILVSSLLSIVYIWRVVEAAYFNAKPTANDTIGEAPASLLIPTWVLIAANIYFGVDTRLTVKLAELVSSTVLGVSPP